MNALNIIRMPRQMGFDDFVWFHAVVEDRMDPEKMGRVRVRVHVIHTENRGQIPVSDLVWAHVAMPVTGASVTGIGEFPNALVPGSWVLGFFRDGTDCQDPVVFASLGGIPEQAANTSKGFFDPRGGNEPLTETLDNAPRKIQSRQYKTDGSGVTLTPEPKALNYPRTTNPDGNVLNEPDTHRLARNEGVEDTLVGVKKNNRVTDVPAANGGTWDEPATPYNAVYPFNHVEASESGHVRETDDTPGAERTAQWNRSGTFWEIGPDGTKVEKIVRNNYTIIMADDFIRVMGNRSDSIQKNLNLLVEQDANIEVKGSLNAKVDKDLNATIEGAANVTIQKDLNATVQGKLTADIKGDGNVSVGGDLTAKADSATVTTSGDLKVKAGGNVSFEVAGNFTVTAGGTASITASSISLTPPPL